MSPYQKLGIPKQLAENERFDMYSNLQIWSYKTGAVSTYNCHVFILELSDESALLDVWERLRNDVAAYFQSYLNIEIEVWNIYILFLVKSKVSRDNKYRIELDKYSSRKIVVDNLYKFYPDFNMSKESSVEDLLNECLFHIDIESSGIVHEHEQTIVDVINGIDPVVSEILADFIPGIKKQKEFYQIYLQKNNIL